MKGEPEFLYHYTTIEVLKNIVENRTLWLGDYRFMNDINEVEYSAGVARRYINKQVKSPDECVLKNVLEIIDSIKKGDCAFYKKVEGNPYVVRDKTKHMGRYILSLTELKDDKDMWTLYGCGNKGVRLKFKVDELKQYIDAQCEPLVKSTTKNAVWCGKVSYNNTTIRKKIDDAVLPLFFKDMINQQYILFSILALNKSSHFKNERECRILISQPDEEPTCKLNKKYAVKDGYIKPFIELSGFPIEKVISEIMISPYNNSELAKSGIEDLIYHNVRSDIKVVKSGITIR